VSQEKKYLLLFGENLRRLRKEKGLSQEHLAIDSDIPTNQIGRIERGEISTGVTTLYRIANALGVQIKDFFDFKDSNT